MRVLMTQPGTPAGERRYLEGAARQKVNEPGADKMA